MREHNLTLDILKVVMAFFIIALHRELFRDCGEVLWGLSDAVVHIAVPTFFIINGYYFADIKDFNSFKRIIKRWSILYVTWTIIYGYFIVRFSDDIITDILLGYFHLWYVVNTIYAFVLIWLLNKYYHRALVIVSIISAVLGVVLAYNSYTGADISVNTYRNFMFFGLPFISIGYLIKKNNFITVPLYLVIVGLGMLVAESLIVHHLWGVDFRMEIGVSLYVVCPALFYICIHSKKTYIGKNLTNFSTGVYLTHQLVLSFVDKIPFLDVLFSLNTISRTVMNILFASICSIIVIMIERKLKIRLL